MHFSTNRLVASHDDPRPLTPPRLDVAHFPAAEPVAAGFALHPGFRRVVQIAGEEIAAFDAAVPVGGGERRDGAAGAGQRILPWSAGAAVVFQEGGGGG